jgi:cardiolipin synthase
MSYIFDYDAAGRRFVDALHRAMKRGVKVRVLVDSAGARYSRPRVTQVLARKKVAVAEFLSPLSRVRPRYLNLRNHRKILVVDGRTGFTGGMNIRAGGLLGEQPKDPIQDLHFKLTGPVVHDLSAVFAEDWVFTTGEALTQAPWHVPAVILHDEVSADQGERAYGVIARGLASGPDDDFETLRWVFLGALAEAREHIWIVTPYFLPDHALITALNLAALRGVRVDIVLPAKSNVAIVGWAMAAQLSQVLEHGCRVWLTPPPFDHSKLMVVDRRWVMFGSGNWDPRSLRLNFEFNVECYQNELATELAAWIDARIARAARVEAEALARRPGLVKVRDGLAWLFTPYL